MRELVAEVRLGVKDLVAPLFVREGISSAQPITSLPGVVQHTLDSLRSEVVQLAELGVPAVILFGIPSVKDEVGSGAFDPAGIVQVALRELHQLGRPSFRLVPPRVRQPMPVQVLRDNKYRVLRRCLRHRAC